MLGYKVLEDCNDDKNSTGESKVKAGNTHCNHTIIEKCISLFKKRRFHCNAMDFDIKDEKMKGLTMQKMFKPEIKTEEKTV